MSAVCVLLAGALLSWPRPAAAVRSAPSRVAGRPDDAAPGRVRCARERCARAGGLSGPVGLLAALGLGAVVAGPGGGLAAAALAATLVRVRRGTRAERARTAAAAGLADALASFAAELRSGAPAAAAADAAGSDAHPVAARALTRIAATAHLGGDVPAALRALAGAPELPGGEHLDRLAAAWALAERHGVALAGPVAAVAVDLRARTRLSGRLSAQLAGPRATAAVLAALPVLGVLLGEGIGARPWAVLSGGGLGQTLLVVGVALVCAGVLWTAHLTARVTR